VTNADLNPGPLEAPRYIPSALTTELPGCGSTQLNLGYISRSREITNLAQSARENQPHLDLNPAARVWQTPCYMGFAGFSRQFFFFKTAHDKLFEKRCKPRCLICPCLPAVQGDTRNLHFPVNEPNFHEHGRALSAQPQASGLSAQRSSIIHLLCPSCQAISLRTP
jgi:hypothetical protein